MTLLTKDWLEQVYQALKNQYMHHKSKQIVCFHDLRCFFNTTNCTLELVWLASESLFLLTFCLIGKCTKFFGTIAPKAVRISLSALNFALYLSCILNLKRYSGRSISKILLQNHGETTLAIF